MSRQPGGVVVRDAQLQEERPAVQSQQKRLLNLRLLKEITADASASTSRDMRERETTLRLEIDAREPRRHKTIGIAVKAFDRSQSLCPMEENDTIRC